MEHGDFVRDEMRKFILVMSQCLIHFVLFFFLFFYVPYFIYVRFFFFSFPEIPKPSLAPKSASELNRPIKDGKYPLYRKIMYTRLYLHIRVRPGLLIVNGRRISTGKTFTDIKIAYALYDEIQSRSI